MELDTGGVLSQLTRATLSQINLGEKPSDRRIVDLEGRASRTQTRVHDLSLGSLTFANMDIQVNTNPNIAPAVAGLLAADLLLNYDVDMDFGSNRLNLFMPSHCGAQQLYWPTLPLAVVAFDLRDTHITIPITLDGHGMTAIIDTGAPYTTLNRDTAWRLFDLDSSRLTPIAVAPIAVAAAGRPRDIYTHRFSSLTFDGVAVSNPTMLVLPFLSDPQATEPYWGHLPRLERMPDAIIGMDILRTLHIYVAYKERRLYITQADKSAADRLPALAFASGP
jgi:hypothetical protein